MTKLLDLWQAQDELSKLITTDTLDVVATWRLSKLIPVLADLNDSRIELIKKLGDPKGKGVFEVKAENIKEFNRQFTEFLDEPLDGFQPIELEKLDGAKLNAVEMAKLAWLIIEPADEAKNGAGPAVVIEEVEQIPT